MKLVYIAHDVILVFTAEGVTVTRTQVMGSMDKSEIGKVTRVVEVPEHVMGRLTLNVVDHLYGGRERSAKFDSPLDEAADHLRKHGVLTDTFYLVSDGIADMIEGYMEYSGEVNDVDGELRAARALTKTLDGMIDYDNVIKTVVPKYSEMIRVKLDPDCCCGYDVVTPLKLTNFRIEYHQDNLAYLRFNTSMMIHPDDDDMHMKVLEQLEIMLKGVIDIDFIGEGYTNNIDVMIIIGEYTAPDLAKTGLRMYAKNKPAKFIDNIGGIRYDAAKAHGVIAPTGKAVDVLKDSYKVTHDKSYLEGLDNRDEHFQKLSESDLPLMDTFYIQCSHKDMDIRIHDFHFNWSAKDDMSILFETTPRIEDQKGEAAYEVFGEIMRTFEDFIAVQDISHNPDGYLNIIELGSFMGIEKLERIGFPVNKAIKKLKVEPKIAYVSAADAPYTGQMEPNHFKQDFSTKHTEKYEFDIAMFRIEYTKSDDIVLNFIITGALEVKVGSKLADQIYQTLAMEFDGVFTLGKMTNPHGDQFFGIKFATKMTYEEVIAIGFEVDDNRPTEEGHFIKDYKVTAAGVTIGDFNICWYATDQMYLQFTGQDVSIETETDTANELFAEMKEAFDGYLELGECTSDGDFCQVSITTVLTFAEAEEMGFPVTNES
jgi:hypothetical protein